MADRRLGRLIQKWLALAGPRLAMCMLLLSWAAAVEGGEQVTSYTETKLTAADGEELDLFGASVAISGDTAVIGVCGQICLGSPDAAVIGAPFDDDADSAYVFKRDSLDPTLWTQSAKLTASDGEELDGFSTSVAISGETAVIGAYFDDDLGFGSGSAYVYAPLRCELALALSPLTLRAGEELRVAVDLDHRRSITVTVPFLLWIEDAAGQVVARKSSPPITLEPGDHRQLRLALAVPPGMRPGTYRVVVGVSRMQQGIAWGSQEVRIVE